MDFSLMTSVATNNLRGLRENTYPGRGLILGRASKEELFQAYWIMGRSENSRNRVFVEDEEGNLRTAAADPNKVKDPSLIIYRAMAEYDDRYVVSNGDQTDTAIDYFIRRQTFQEAMRLRQYEPDEPNFTPRITGLISLRSDEDPLASISILRESAVGDLCDRFLFEYDELPAGFGYCITTYSGDGEPLPAFQGEPYLLPFSVDDEREIAATLWADLNPDNRVSLAVKVINQSSGYTRTHIINKYEQVAV